MAGIDLFQRGGGWKRYNGEDLSDHTTPLPVSNSTPELHHFSIFGGNSNSSKSNRVRLLDKSRTAKGVERFGLPQGGWYLYWQDIFHTLLNMPRHRFLLVFFTVYFVEYIIFALLYLTQPDHCVGGAMKFSHALWFSVQTAATLGYTSSLQPNIDCTSVNMLVIIQVITAALIDYCMMGLVFARFASPNKRCITIRFSNSAVLYQRSEDHMWSLSFRIANIRKHALLKPEVHLLLALPDPHSPSGSHFQFHELELEDKVSQLTNLKLGLHAHVSHVIRPGTPMFDLSLNDLEERGAEVLCFMEGIDPMTSNNMQARHSYTPADIRMNERFVPLELQIKGSRLGLDFSGFDATTQRAATAGGAEVLSQDGGSATFMVPVPPQPATLPVSVNVAGPSGSDLLPDGVVAAALSDSMASHMQALRTRSVRSLTGALGPLAASVGRGAAPSQDVRDLCDAVLTDAACSASIKRQAAAVKEALQTLDHHAPPSYGTQFGAASPSGKR